MKLHILGICGTFMGGVAALARELGHDVEGSDANVYPPMSTQLETLGIRLHEGYLAQHLQPPPDQVLVGNALSRGNEAVEHVLDAGLDYASGPQWLGDSLLRGRPVLAVAGTHGKTTTSSLLAFLLDRAGFDPGFLIGGVPANFGVSARLGGSTDTTIHAETSFPRSRASVTRDGTSSPRLRGEVPEGRRGAGAQRAEFASVSPASGGKSRARPAAPPFVIEADEYDTAFFDKRSKFVHYRPQIAVLNNLEYDHADIFPDLAAIERQFHHLVRTVPGNGRLIVNAHDDNLARVLRMGCWTPVQTFGLGSGDWQARLLESDGSAFSVSHLGRDLGEVRWSLLGRHNVLNALAALAAAAAHGADAAQLVPCLGQFRSVSRRMEHLASVRGIEVYDDFAHHPTAIAATLAGLRARVGKGRILVALEPRSNSMRQGVHAAELAPSLAAADRVVLLQRPELEWDAAGVMAALHGRGQTVPDVAGLLQSMIALSAPGDHVVFMSNGGFEGAPRRFAKALREH